MECILQSELITDVAAEENGREQDRERRRSGDGPRAKAQEPWLAELRLKEQRLQERERALKEREERLEREWAVGVGGLQLALREMSVCLVILHVYLRCSCLLRW